MILALGVIAFGFGTAGGVLLAKVMNIFSKEKVNPLIGSAGVSAVPMAARVSQVVAQKYDPSNFLLMHAMGPQCVRRDRVRCGGRCAAGPVRRLMSLLEV